MSDKKILAIDMDEGIITNEAGGRIISTFDAATDFGEGPGGGDRERVVLGKSVDLGGRRII